MVQSLSIANEHFRILPGPQTLQELIIWNREEVIALDYLDGNERLKHYSYGGLRSCVLSLAGEIQKHIDTIEPNGQPVIPLLVPQSPALYITILAILEIGGAFCPINLDSPPERVKFVVQDVQASIIITTRDHESTVSWDGGPKVIFIDEAPVTPQASIAKSPSKANLRPEDLAYVMYTSGSSGTPKGVGVSHLAASQSLLAHQKHIPSFKRFLQFAAPSFDVSVFEIFFPLVRGATLVCCNRARMLNDLPGVINKLNIDAAELTPTVAGSLVQLRSNVRGLRLLLTIGEMLTRPVIDQFGQSDSEDGILYGMYGPTEAAIHCTVNPNMKAGSSVRNIGIPFDTTSTFIVAIDESSEPPNELRVLPLGETGELVLGGPQLANGYLNRPDQNKSAFVTVRGKRAYRTGDKARMLEDGTIEIHGRISAGQVKIRGQRVELGEVEEAVYKHPNIKSVMASVLNGVLVVFALQKELGSTPEDILRVCGEWLPKFMIPSEIQILDSFPYLPSGKIAKKQLEADYESQRTDIGNSDSDELTKTEASVGSILQDFLGRRISLTERLGSYGLDSLLAIRIASRLRMLGFPLSTVQVLESGTLAELAKLCESTSENSPDSGTVLDDGYLHELSAAARKTLKENHAESTGILPCTPLQDAMLSETAVDALAYNNEIELQIASGIDEEMVQKAIYGLAQHNPILQTGFVECHNPKSVYAQVTWKSLLPSQFETVTEFIHDTRALNGFSLLRPFHVQLKKSDSHVRLLIHLHHAIYDAWSLELLLDDFNSILNQEQVSARPPFRIVVEAALQATLSEESWSSKEYWKDHLLQLDTRPLPSFHSVCDVDPGLRVTDKSTDISTAKLESAAREFDVSPQSFFQAAYALILGSYLGTKDVCFGTVFSGRTSAIEGIEDVAGPCLSTLPTRVDLGTVSSSKALVQQLASITRKHLKHDVLPLREIKKLCKVDPGRSIFDSIMVWQQTLHDNQSAREQVVLRRSTDFLEFNLTIEITPGAENIELKANYQQAIFPEEQVQIFLQQIEQLVQIMTARSSKPLELIFSILDTRLLSVENPQPEVDRMITSLSASVESIAAESPDRPAILFAHSLETKNMDIERVTYGELNSYANQIAHHLNSIGVAPDDLVCICMEKSVDLYASILGILKSGAGYLPVTPDIPPGRLKYTVSEATVQVIIAHSSMKSVLNIVSDRHIVYIDELDRSSLSSENLLMKFGSNNLAYCVFTSGSTGTPKGVLITHENLMSNIEVLSDLYPHSQEARLLQSCSQAFDVSVFEIFWTWHIGGCLCSAVKDVMFRDIELAIRSLDVTHLSLTPTVAALIDPVNVPNVKFLVTAGEAVTQKVFNTWAGKGLYQGYGPSETTNICTVRPNVTSRHLINNIGAPFKNTSVFVLEPDAGFNLVPRGAEGEFCFGGSQVGRGYLNASQAVGKFFDHPGYGKLYRSGDMGRLMPDGSLSFTRRLDDQVKIRGQRVELGEINSTILQLSEVVDCATVVIGDKAREDQRLISFWLPKDSASSAFRILQPDASIIRTIYSAVALKLPTYMIPSAFIPISKLPSTSQGKVDRRLLIGEYKSLSTKYLDSTSHKDRDSSDHEWSGTERKIADSVAQVVKVSPSEVGPDTSFFSLGIDSISAISLARILRETHNINVQISDILKLSSVVRLASIANSKSSTSSLDATKSSQYNDFGFDEQFLATTMQDFKENGLQLTHIAPCTPLQEAMLSASESAVDNAYCNHTVLAIIVSIEEFKYAWSSMIGRHEILRTCFVKTDMARFAFAQVVTSDSKKVPQVIKEPTKDSAEVLMGLYSDEIAGSQYEPPYSLSFIQSRDSTKLLISMHHALYDGVALSILFEEVEKTLKHESLPPSVSFTPFLRNMIAMNTEKADQYWDKLLAGYNPVPLPQSSKRAETLAKSQSSMIRRSARSNLSWIESHIKSHSSSLISVCQAVWASLLAKKVQSSDVCFGNVVSGRTVPVEGIDRLVAPCFNTLPVRIADIHKLSYLEASRSLQSQNIDSLPFQLTPLRRIQSRCQTDGVKLFDSLFILQPPSREFDSSIWTIEDDIGAMDLPIVIEITPNPSKNALEFSLHYQSQYLLESEAQSVLEDFESTLAKSISNPRYQVLTADVAKPFKPRPRHQRKQPGSDTGEDKSEDSDNMNPLELTIRDIFATLTNVPAERIGLKTSIHRIGLDSISAVQVATALRKQGHRLMASDVLEHTNVQKLANFLHQQSPEGEEKTENFDFGGFEKQYRNSVCARLDIDNEVVEAVRPCTPVQCGMLAQSLHSGGAEYINSFSMKLLPDVSLDKLRSAWQHVMAQHEMLRTGFAELENSHFQFAMVTYSSEHAGLPWLDTVDVAQRSATEAQGEVMQQLSRSPWQLRAVHGNEATLLQFSAHHALYDAQSLDLILSDVTKAYASGQSVQHGSINCLLGAILNSAAQNEEERKAFCQNENPISLNRFPDLTPLREDSQKSSFTELTSAFSTLELEDMCKERNVSVQALGQAAWARLLSAYIGEPLVTFGVTLSGRSILDDASEVPFPSIVTLPATCNVTGSNDELLEKTMHLSAQMHKHQFTPLTKIQKWSGNRDSKMFDTLFAYQKTESADASLTPFWEIVNEESSADYTASIELMPMGDGSLVLRLTAKENIVPAEHAELILRQFDALLENTLRKPEQPCNNFNTENAELLSITPAKESVLAGDIRFLHQCVEHQLSNSGDGVALEFATAIDGNKVSSKMWTFTELNDQGNGIANLLLSNDVKQGSLIAVCFDKCPAASFAILGIMKAGCAYVALDPNAPVDRLIFIIDDSKAAFVLTTGKPAEKLRGVSLPSNVAVVDIGHDGNAHRLNFDVPVLSRPIVPEDTCYCLYTSGTTGTPKGCEITHDNAVQAMFSFSRLFAGHWNSTSKWLQFASFHFDVSVLEQFWSWQVGICCVSAPRDLIFEDIPAAIRALGITHIDLTPSLARLLHPDDVPSLCEGVFITGGEQLRQDILDVWGPKNCIYNGYGPTEVTIGCTMYTRVPANGKPANIGPQWLNVGSYVLKRGTDEPVLRGAVGELVVSGKLVGKGYLNRPDLTQERFPYIKSLGERVYRTGDLVRILSNDDFLFLGRADDQVKLRGQRLELSEINEVIKKNVEGVDDVVTLVLKHSEQQSEQLVTFFVQAKSHSEQNITGAMRDACKSRLPGYMVPTHFISLEALPLSANNKADAKQLAKYYNDFSIEDLQKISAASHTSAKWTKAEKALVDVLAKALSVETTALTSSTNIFELGIDSISVIGLSRALQNAGYDKAKLSTVMKNSSIGDLVKVLTSHTNGIATPVASSITLAQNLAAFSHKHKAAVAEELDVDGSSIEDIAPCTPAQEGMIYRFLDSDEAPYFNHFGFLLEEDVDESLLVEAWSKVVDQLQILRTNFVLTTDGCVQVVLKSLQQPWESVKVDISDEAQIFKTLQDRQHRKTLQEESKALGSPWTISVGRHGTKRVLSLQIFHGLYDGISLPMILQKVNEEYHGVEDVNYGPQFYSVLPHGPLSVVDGAKDFWSDTLKNVVYKALPKIIEHPTSQGISSTRIISGLDHLEPLRQRLGVTYQAILQAAWVSVLQEYLTANPSFGLVISGRSIDFDGAEEVIGPLLNTVVFHIKVNHGATWESLIQACHAYNTAMLPYQHTPLKDVQKWCGGGTNQPLFDTLFVFQREEKYTFEEESLWKVIPSAPVADYPLAFEAELKQSGDIQLTVVGQGTYLNDKLAAQLLTKVEGAIRFMEKPNSAVPTHAPRLNGYTNGVHKAVEARDTNGTSNHDNFTWSLHAEAIRSVIRELSGATEITENSSIFELGLDSIDVIKLSSRLKKAGVQLSVSSIIRSQTIAKMVTQISGKPSSASQSVSTVAKYEKRLVEHLRETNRLPKDTLTVLPATPLQEGMIAEMISSNFTNYFNHELYHVSFDVDIGRLKRSWDTAVQKHDILRTTFVEIDDTELPMSFAQLVHNPPKSIWQIEKGERNVSLDDLYRDIVQQATQRAAEGHLLQLTDIECEGDRYFVISIAHALYDGWSLQALHEDIRNIYHGHSIERPSPRTILDEVLSQDSPEAIKFWQTSLSGLPHSIVPPRQDQLSKNASTVHRFERKSIHALSKVQEFCRLVSTTLQTLGETAWSLVLAQYLRRLDVVFGVVLSCRDTEEASKVMFPLMNTVAVRSVLHGTIKGLLQYMQDNANAMREFQHFPLRKAQLLAGIDKADGGLFNTLFIYQGQRNQSTGKSLYESVESVSAVEFAICVELEIVDGALVWRTACKDSVRSATQTQELLNELDGLLGRIMSKPDAPTINTNGNEISICGLEGFTHESDTHTTEITKKPSLSPNSSNWTRTELALREVLSQMTKISEEDIEKDQTIFHLGLDSISAIKMSSILRRQGIRLGVSDMLKNNTITSMANFLSGSQEETTQDPLDTKKVLSATMESVDSQALLHKAKIDRNEVETLMPVTAGQLYMLARWHYSGGTMFHATFSYTLQFVDEKRLNAAWTTLQERNPILRTRFLIGEQTGIPAFQVVLRKPQSRIQWSEIPDREKSHVSPTSPLHLSADRNGKNAVIKLQIHHALYDGISLPLVLHDFEALYNNPETVTPTLGFRNFVAHALSSASVNNQQRQQFWQSHLGDSNLTSFNASPFSKLPTKKVEVFQPSIAVGNLITVARAAGVTVDALLLATFSKLYSRLLLNTTSEVTFGLYLSNRSAHHEYAELRAPTLNLLPIRVQDSRTTITKIAEKLQIDLQAISGAEVVNSNLLEIMEWTGVRVDCFINILKSPLDETSLHNQPSLFNAEKEETALRRARAEIVDISPSTEIQAQVDKENLGKLKEAYLPSLDIELHVMQDGTLDVGVFAPEEMLSVDAAKALIGELGEELRALS